VHQNFVRLTGFAKPYQVQLGFMYSRDYSGSIYTKTKLTSTFCVDS